MDARLTAILTDHEKWLVHKGGARANFDGAYLRGVFLRNVTLRRAILDNVNLIRADLEGTDFKNAGLRYADLRGANLMYVNFSGANLMHANLAGANIEGADLRGTILMRTNLRDADLRKTCLDPDNIPNGKVDDFEREGEFVVGYRTRQAGHIDKYRDGRYYSADIFSTCEVTECHPGLYLWPDLRKARIYSGEDELIKVVTLPSEVHQAGTKWRCRWFKVVGSV